MAKFTGKASEFRKAVDDLQLNGSWEEFSLGLRYRTSDGGTIQWFHSTKTIQVQGNEHVRNKLSSLMDALEKNDTPIAVSASTLPEKYMETTKENNKIFIVHGHDYTSREQLELIIHKLGLDPFVLANSSGGGLTIIEALEEEIGKGGRSGIGIVLLTPDDIGYSKIDGQDKAQPRARQNVVLEMGMLMSAVGRRNTIILKKGSLEVPSDANGILYLSFSDHVKETVPRLVERLRASGFNIDASRVTRAAS